MISQQRMALFINGVLLVTVAAMVVSSWSASARLTAASDGQSSSATGYFGLDDEGVPIADRHGVMIVFDGAIKPETISENTFLVSLEDGTFADVLEAQVEGSYVFLRLRDELPSDARPIVGLAEGEVIEDLAGNTTNHRELGFIQIADGISPRLSVTLGGGSGRGTGDEGPDRLTNDTIDIRVTSDEPLQGAPRVLVLCESLSWQVKEGSRNIERDVDDFIANRNGPFSIRPRESSGTSYTCGYDANGDRADDPFELVEDVTYSRPGEVWEYEWSNRPGDATSLQDGRLVVVAYGRDRSRYERFGQTVSNWATGMADFMLDTEFASHKDDVEIIPADGSTIKETRPFVIIDFYESTTVDLLSFVIDGRDLTDEIEQSDMNRFLYWPLAMKGGKNVVEVAASDSAGNFIDLKFSFEVVLRESFVLHLEPGWNAISLPADPVVRDIEAVFTEPAIEAMIAWKNSYPKSWVVAIRRDGKWTDNDPNRRMSEIRSRRGYWVKASKPTRQKITLTNPIRRVSPRGSPTNCISGCLGWIFVGVVDQGGYQTENHFGEPLVNSKIQIVRAQDYLNRPEKAFTWDPVTQRFEHLLPDDPVIIGDGIWAYYGPSKP